jgi:type VI secretion system protein ImpA
VLPKEAKLISIDELLQEISPDAPCGDDLEYDPAFGALERAAERKPEQQFGETVIPAEEPDWAAVQVAAVELFSTTKDLRIAAHLTRALARTDGWSGIADGLMLMQGLLGRYWECVHPQLDPAEDNDPTFRVNTISTLADRDAILDALRSAPLVQSSVLGRVSLRDVQIAAGELPLPPGDTTAALDKQSIDAAFKDAEAEKLRLTATAVRESIDCVAAIESLLMERVGPTQAPDLGALSELLKAADKVLGASLALRSDGAPSGQEASRATGQESGEAEARTFGEGTAAAGGARIGGRDDVIRVLDQVCRYYERQEPSSPVPLLLERAKRLVAKDFMAIVRDLAPDGVPQIELIRGTEPDGE